MTTLILDSAALKATAVEFTDDSLVVELADRRSISAPLAWYPRLFHGTVAERGHSRFIAGGEGIHWPDLDEDISIEGIVAGRPSGESPRSLQKWLESRHDRRVTVFGSRGRLGQIFQRSSVHPCAASNGGGPSRL